MATRDSKTVNTSLIPIVLLCLWLGGCAWIIMPKSDQIDVQYCYDGRDTGITSLLNINGYYEGTIQVNLEDGPTTGFLKYIFYKDGSYYENGNWGRYIIQDNVIKAQSRLPRLAMHAGKQEAWFEVVNTNTLLKIAHKNRGLITDEEIQNNHIQAGSTERHELTFIASDTLPDPNDNWLKNHKWFWCSEHDFSAWKRIIR